MSYIAQLPFRAGTEDVSSLIAEQLGQNQLVNNVVNYLKASFAPWVSQHLDSCACQIQPDTIYSLALVLLSWLPTRLAGVGSSTRQATTTCTCLMIFVSSSI